MLESLTPAQQVVKIVRDELEELLGEEGRELEVSGKPAVILLCGLQGSGKTTTAGKLAKRLSGRGRHPLLVAGDLQRAAAVEQLVQVGAAVDTPVVEPGDSDDLLALCDKALKTARDRGHDVILFDTAGRLHVDERLMDEIRVLAERLDPAEILFVADSMTGQDAVKSAGEFAQALSLTGVILTKLDGDTRGGAALSIRTVAKVPIRFLGMGEKPADLELFRPDRMASRILGMGDVLSLIEKAEQGLDADESQPPGRETRETAVHPRGPARPATADAADGPSVAGHGDAAQDRSTAGAGRRVGRREPTWADRSDDRFDDPPGAARAEDPERQQKTTRGQGLWGLGPGDQPAPQAVPSDAQDAEGYEGELAQEGRGTEVGPR